MARKKSDTKDRYLPMIVHDMKGPLSVIIANLDLLQSSRLNKRDHKILRITSQECRNLLHMIQNILDIGKMEARDMELNLSVVNLKSFMGSFAEMMGPVGAGKSVRIGIRHKSGRKDVAVDERLLERMLFNLVLNAVQHVPEGGQVLIGTEDGDEKETLKIFVSDDGPGIPEEDRHRIFDLYFQGRRPRPSGGNPAGRGGGLPEKAYGGSAGIGLAFCKLASEKHGGNIRVETVSGKGCTFIVELPTDLVPSGSGLF